MANRNQRHITISTRPHLFLEYNVDLTLNLPFETSETVMLEHACITAARLQWAMFEHTCGNMRERWGSFVTRKLYGNYI